MLATCKYVPKQAVTWVVGWVVRKTPTSIVSSTGRGRTERLVDLRGVSDLVDECFPREFVLQGGGGPVEQLVSDALVPQEGPGRRVIGPALFHLN